jgi:ABC-type cobalamin/Fe3+-siderophores transport system ATPase subunit
MTAKKIKPLEVTAENPGPIQGIHFVCDSPGVWVVSAPNGAGKSYLMDTIQKAAAGEGKIGVRDGETKGFIEVGGARVTFGRQTRHGGEFQILNLEGRFNLKTLVDPGVVSAEAADKRRIATLVQIAGVVGDPALFKAHEAFADYDEVCDAEITRRDLVEMAGKVKARYEKAAREVAENASAAKTKATTLMAAASDLPMDAETDAEKLQAAYDTARDTLVKAESQVEQYGKQKEAMREAQDALEAEEKAYDGPTVEAANAEFDASLERQSQIGKQIALLQQQLEVVKEKTNTANERLKAAKEHQKVVESATRVIKAGTIVPPTAADVAGLSAAKQISSDNLELGVKVREAKKNLDEGKELQKQAEDLERKSERLRESAKATEDVLSAAISSARFRVKVVDGVTRVVVDHSRGADTFYHELSHGEKWHIAIDEGADRVGEGGLLPLDQEGWEGIDAFERPGIAEHAAQRCVIVLAPEATRDVKDGRAMLVRKYTAVDA